MTQKTASFLACIETNPGINTMTLHGSVGKLYAHGHHRYSYETIKRMLRNGLVKRGPSVNGRGVGLYPAK